MGASGEVMLVMCNKTFVHPGLTDYLASLAETSSVFLQNIILSSDHNVVRHMNGDLT